MQVYLVGGAVRDELLGRKIRENDYVVVNETPEAMLKRGFKQVGKDFPVFLHPKTQEEYALARKERKTETGHHGFALDIEKVTLEEDLLRRDLTINAIAKDLDGNIVDPYEGQKDLENKILRHVSEAFVEDPLRVFRVARFQAMLPDFKIHPETLKLMSTLCHNKAEIQSLPTERIWMEIEKASKFEGFHLFWKTLEACHGLDTFGIQITDDFLKALENSTSKGTFKLISGLWDHTHPKSFLIFKPPSDISDAIKILDEHREVILEMPKDPEKLLSVLHRLDPFRREDRATEILETLLDKNITSFWKDCIQAVVTVDISEIISQEDGQKIAKGIAKARLNALKHLLGNK